MDAAVETPVVERLTSVPERMSFADCAREAEASHQRYAERQRALALRVPARRRGLRLAPPRRSQSLGLPTFTGASMGRENRDWMPGTLSSDGELRDGLRILRNRGRELRRNSPYALSFLRLGKINVVSPYGFTVRPQVRDENDVLDATINRAIQRYYLRFARGPVTLERGLNLARALALAWETGYADGECFIRLIWGAANPWGLALQFIDADLIDEHFNRPAVPGQNEIRMGVELDAQGGRVGYWVTRAEPGYDLGMDYGMSPGGERYFVPAYDPFTGRGEMLHYFLPQRPNQTRGYSRFHAAMEVLHQLGALHEAELFSSRVGATPLGFIVAGEDAQEPEDDDENEAEGTGAAAVDGEPAGGRPARATDPREIVAETAAFYRLHKGETIAQWKAEHPNAVLPEFSKIMLQAAAVAFGGLYYEMAGDLEGVNFTSSRAGQLSQRDIWRLEQEALIEQVALPVYQALLRIALLRGAITVGRRRLVGAVAPYADVDIRGRGWDLVQPLEDMQARALRIATGMGSRQQFAAEDNEDCFETIDQLAEEKQYADARGVTIDPPGSIAADVTASIARNAERARSEGPPPGVKKNGNGANGGTNGLRVEPSVSTIAPRVGASRF